jgi:DNA polymerase IV
MSSKSSSLEKKIAFFQDLDALNKSTSDEDELEQGDQDLRSQGRSFFGAIQNPVKKGKYQKPSSVVQKHSPLLQKRTPSAPLIGARPDNPIIIEATPAGPNIKPQLQRPAVEPLESGIGDTPIPDSTCASRQAPQRSNSTPLPASRRLRSGIKEDSPSIGLALKKRKREAAVKQVPESERLFQGFKFYYIPDDDIHPARRMRIAKAREYGADWTRNISDATHVIVDKGLTYNNIQAVLSNSETAPAKSIVNEEYPIDCIRFKNLLNPIQKQYQIPGFPSTEASDLMKSTPASALEPKDEGEPTTKDLEAATRELGHYSPKAMPSQGRQPSRAVNHEVLNTSEVSSTDAHVMPSISLDKLSPGNREFKDGENVTPTISNVKPIPGPNDELLGLIELIQQYKHLPLEGDEDEVDLTGDAHSDGTDAGSGSDDDNDDRVKRQSVGKGFKPGQKVVSWEDKFACNQGGTLSSAAQNPNARTIEVLQNMCDYYTRVDDTWRTLAYRRAISTLKRQSVKIATAEDAYKLPNIGPRLATKIEEIVTTDRLKRLEYAQLEPIDHVLQLFLGIYDVGHSQANRWIAQGYRTLDELKEQAKLTKNQRIGVDHYEDLNSKIPRKGVEALGEVVRRAAAKIDAEVELIIGGSYRRGADHSNDIDFVVTKRGTSSRTELAEFLRRLIQTLEGDQFIVATLAQSHSPKGDGSKWHGCCVLPQMVGDKATKYTAVWRRIDFLLVPETELGAALIYFTGNDIFNRSIRLLASKKGMRLNQTGLYQEVAAGPRQRGKPKSATRGKLLEGRDERRIFEILGVKWREAHERIC